MGDRARAPKPGVLLAWKGRAGTRSDLAVDRRPGRTGLGRERGAGRRDRRESRQKERRDELFHDYRPFRRQHPTLARALHDSDASELAFSEKRCVYITGGSKRRGSRGLARGRMKYPPLSMTLLEGDGDGEALDALLRRFLAEDIGRADVTTDATVPPGGASRGRDRGEVRSASSPVSPWPAACSSSSIPSWPGRTKRRPASPCTPPARPRAALRESALDPDGGARRAEPAAADVRHRDGDAAVRRGRGRHGLPDPRHAEDGARTAPLRPPGRPRRRRRQSPIRSDGDGPHQGQPPPPRRRRRAGRRRGARLGARPERPSKSRSSRRTTSRKPSRPAPSGS